jgi:hypothetical protein
MFRKIIAHATTASVTAIAGCSVPNYLDLTLPTLPSLHNSALANNSFEIDIGAMKVAQTVGLCSTIAWCYWKGVGFADIAYATRRSVQDLKSALQLAKQLILDQITKVEHTLNHRADQLDEKIVQEAAQIRQDIDALHRDHASATASVRKDIRELHVDQRELTSTVEGIGHKVTKIETMSSLSSRGVSFLCGAMVPKYTIPSL